MQRALNYMILLGFLVFFVKCKDNESFLVEKNNVGKISSVTVISDLYVLFENDSVVNRNENLNFDLNRASTNEFFIYTKEEGHILTVAPLDFKDDKSKIKYIEILSPKFKTKDGVSLLSTFKDVNKYYTINKVESTLSSVTLYIDQLNATLAIDKGDLGIEGFGLGDVSLEQIPDAAKIKNFTIWFE